MTAAVPAGGETGISASLFSLPAPLRVVLDTNVLVSLWIFTDSRYALLRTALEDGRWLALTRADCLDEFGRVLNYPQFAISPERQRRALDEYRQLAGAIASPSRDAYPLPRCRDRDDQKFLEVARDGDAHWLVTSDKALLRLACRRKLAGLFRILTPDAALAELWRGFDHAMR